MDARAAAPFSWFSSSEGVYTLIASHLTPVTHNFLGSSAPAGNVSTAAAAVSAALTGVALPAQPASGTGAAGAAAAASPNAVTPIDTATVLPPPPLHPSKFAVVSVKYPAGKESSGGVGLGLGMSMLRGGSVNKNQSGQQQRALAEEQQPADSSSTSSNGREGIPIPSAPSPILPDGAASLAGPPAATSSSTGKRRPLTSSFSIPTLSSLGSSVSPPSTSDGSSSSRPQRPFKGTSSTFIRSWEGIPLPQVQQKFMAEQNAGKETTFLIVTSGKGILFMESGSGKLKEPLARLVFAAPPTAVDINQSTANYLALDCLLGFTSGDIFWFDPFCGRYTRFNKSGVITNSQVTSIQWLPISRAYSSSENHSNLFISSHADGTVLIWDKDREDAPFNPSSPRSPLLPSSPMMQQNGNAEQRLEQLATQPMVVSKPSPVVDKKGVGSFKHNPVSHWQVSTQCINALAFSPDLRHVAIVGEDGLLRIVDVAAEAVTDVYASYFGALKCVAWSSDGRFVVTGGQDDLCTVYAPSERRIVARCQGHSSWVTAIQWDPWKSDDRTMRFASVGEDCKLILWDLSSAALSRPKAHASHVTHQRRHSASSNLSLARRKTIESASGYPLSPDGDEGPIFHATPPRSEVAMLQPVVVKTLSSDVLVGLKFLSHSVLLLSRTGQIRHYDRPPEGEAARIGLLTSAFAASTVDINSRAR